MPLARKLFDFKKEMVDMNLNISILQKKNRKDVIVIEIFMEIMLNFII